MPRTTAEIVAHADELARMFEDYEPRPGDEHAVSALTLLRLAALKRAEVKSVNFTTPSGPPASRA